MGDITDHLVHVGNNKINKMKNSMEANIYAYDSNIEELFKHNKYNQFKILDSGMDSNTFIDNYSSYIDISKNLLDLMDQNTKYQKQLLNTLDKESQSASKSYNKSADMYRNQKFVEDVVKEEIKSLKKNNKSLYDGLDNTKRNIEINNYYYKKNKVQIRILYYLIGLCILIYALGYLNKHYAFLFNDNFYVLCVGLMIGLFVIYLGYSFYDIYLRDDHNFDEYKTFWKTRVGDVSGAVDIPNEIENNYDFSLCDVN